MSIQIIFRNIILIPLMSILLYANNCPKWFPLPSNGLVVVIPIYNPSITGSDLDCDELIDSIDSDIDGDGVANSSDAFPLNSSESIDSDGDGIGDNTDRPIAHSQHLSIHTNVINYPILITGSDDSATALTFNLLSMPTHGTLDASTLPQLSYTPQANYEGADSFTFSVNDGNMNSYIATIYISINPIEQGVPILVTPLAQNISTSLPIGTLVSTISVDSNSTTSFSIINGNTHNDFNINSNGEITTQHLLNYATTSSYSLEITASNTIGESMPVIQTIEINSILTASGFPMTLDINKSTVVTNWKNSTNAIDADGDSLTASVKTQGNYGNFVVTGDSLAYLKTVESNSTDYGTLEITDGTHTIEVVVMIHSLYWKEISAGVNHSVAIKSDGTLWAWGFNFSGMLGDGTTMTKKTPVQEASQSTNWIKVSTGREHTVALKSDGTLWAWGINNHGQLGIGNTSNKNVPTQEESNSTNWTDISAKGYYTLARKNDGTLWAWGLNFSGMLGDGTTVNKVTPTQEASLSTNWIAFSAGVSHSLGLKDNGTLWAWGANSSGQLGNGSTTQSLTPIQEASHSTNWVKISANYLFSLGIKNDHTLWAWGSNNHGQLGDGTNTNRHIPVQEVSGSSWREVSAGGYATRQYALAIKTDGTLWAWGKNEYGQLANGTNIKSNIPVQEFSLSTNWSYLYASERHTMALKNNGTLWIWGSNQYGEHGNNTTDAKKEIPTQEIFKRQTWTSISAGSRHTMAIKSDGTLWGWGYNGFGQLGKAFASSIELAPVQESTLSTHWVKVDTGENHTIALKDDGTLWTWGRNQYGQLGDNTLISKATPTQEYSKSTDWIDISSGLRSCAAIKSNGTLWAWGSNQYGQLGDNSTTHRKQPTQEHSNSTNWTAVDKGNMHTLALKNDGTLWAWGSNIKGQLGNGTTINSSVPIQESTLATDWSHISGGHEHSLALKTNGTLWAWGSNTIGELGINSLDNKQVPTPEYTQSTAWVSISAGGTYFNGVSMAIKDNGTLWAWGSGSSGRLGNGTIYSKKVPTQEYSQSTTWTEVNAGENHALGVKSDHTLWAWGNNNNNVLSTDAIIPQQPIKRQ